MCDDTARLRIQKYAELARENCPDVPERVHPHLWRHYVEPGKMVSDEGNYRISANSF